MESSIPASGTNDARRRFWRRFFRTPLAAISSAWVVAVAAACIFYPAVTHQTGLITDVAHSYASPSSGHILGTDGLGRDEFVRVLIGGRVSLLVGFVAAIVAMFIGTCVGAIAGFYGAFVDALLMRMVDVFLAVPTLFLLLFLAAMFHGNVATLIVVIGATSWLGPSRLVRGDVLTIKERLYVEAARSLGAADARVLWRHIIPNAAGTIVTTTTFMVANAMLAETALSYLGIGVRAPTPSWGNLLSSAQSDVFAGAYWLIVPPGLAILLTVTALNFIGDWLRENAAR
ncbi:MAG: ABC transporter permease [Candidatus Eremiobacteraeota bacterium]|nr:ABC transporter permease [Candidatus Eremiobacteraeota bacterium]